MALSLVRANPEVYAKLITHRYPLNKATEALEAVGRGETVKAVLEPSR